MLRGCVLCGGEGGGGVSWVSSQPAPRHRPVCVERVGG